MLVNGFERLAGNDAFAMNESNILKEHKMIKTELQPNKIEARPKFAPLTNKESMSISRTPDGVMEFGLPTGRPAP